MLSAIFYLFMLLFLVFSDHCSLITADSLPLSPFCPVLPAFWCSNYVVFMLCAMRSALCSVLFIPQSEIRNPQSASSRSFPLLDLCEDEINEISQQ
jgi:hypothetical protein